MAQQQFNDQESLNLVRSKINSNAVDAENRLGDLEGITAADVSDKSQLTETDTIPVHNDGSVEKVNMQVFSNRIGTGYERTSGFLDTSVTYTTTDVSNGAWKVLSLDATSQATDDSPYWTSPTPSDHTGVGLFGGDHMPIGVSSLFDFSFDFDTTYPTLADFTSQSPTSNAQDSFDYFSGSTGKLDLSGCLPGDLLKIRFDFNATPQVANTTLEPALWYANRDGSDKETFSFPLTANPIFYGTGSVGKTYLCRVEISAWIAQDQDVNALALPAIKCDNQIIVEPLGLLAQIIR